jgi:cystathionine gamma-synthase
VRYPGLPTDPQHDKAKSFMKGFGAIVSFEYDGNGEATDRVCESSKIVTYATSLGGVESLWERRRRWPIESASVPESLIRLSVGCEDVEDLWADIAAALQAAK